ncbi:multiheme c-type cytochrome [Phenylobacterium sp.]|uniref:multiheme c-type cytochrome n=1 Tax=Phenylobacterium sp. TaxID=1871053 RepID=UPI002E33791B|nr:multiheme c-type cytochrome [Phenylobacterium sp.]HEX3367346.1 multiheme c-type cytochrome [Phenylobacterium sp.]
MGRGRATGVMGLLAAALAVAVAMAATHAARAQSEPPVGGRVGVHEGVASCGGSTCHSRPVASGLTVRQNELITWQDPHSEAGAHSRAWKVLTQPRAEAITAKLGLGPAERAVACLGCHSDPAPAGQRGARFQVSDGVGCEACHGGSGGWIASHYALGATHVANVSRGMLALDEPKVRAARCLDCHFGGSGPNQFVTHQIMAAGHPQISFELDLFTSLQKHHDVDADYLARHKVAAGGVKTWAVGQAMAVNRALTLYGPKTPGGAFPEFVFFDCQSCHRTFSSDPKWRPVAEPNPGRPIPVGTPPFNDENMIMLSAAAKVAAPALSARFEGETKSFHQALAQNGAVAASQAARLAATSHELADVFAARSFSRADTLAIFEAVLSGDTVRRYTDFAGVTQAVMAADTLLSSLVAEGAIDRAQAARVRPDIDRASQAVRDPNAFHAAEARAALQQAAEKVRGLK